MPDKPEQLHFDLFCEPQITRLPEGGVIVRPGKVQVRATVSTGEAARLLDCSCSTVRRYIDEGLLRTKQRKGRGHHRVLVEDIKAMRDRDSREL